VTARHLGGHDDRILPLLYECAVEPHFFGFAENLLFLGKLAELVEELGWERSSELVCNLSAKLLGRGRPAPERFRLEAMKIYEPIEAAMAANANEVERNQSDYDQDALVTALGSGNLQSIFQGLSDVLAAGGDVDRIITTMVLLAADRMARTSVNANPGWGALAAELNLAASLREGRRDHVVQIVAEPFVDFRLPVLALLCTWAALGCKTGTCARSWSAATLRLKLLSIVAVVFGLSRRPVSDAVEGAENRDGTRP
jgi:hypothetical protein